MIPRFAKPVPVLSMMTNTVVDFIYNMHGHRITQGNKFLSDQLKLEQYSVAVAEKGAALDNSYGFIDGTVRPLCRLQDNQRVVHNGHKRVHAIKFQSVTVHDSSDFLPSR